MRSYLGLKIPRNEDGSLDIEILKKPKTGVKMGGKFISEEIKNVLKSEVGHCMGSNLCDLHASLC